VYFFLNPRGDNVIKRWLAKARVPIAQIATFQAKLDTLEQGGPEASPGLIVGPLAKDIFKMRIKGNRGWVQLRPMVCYGPFSPDREVTLLVGAIEKDGKYDPQNAVARAQDNIGVLRANPHRRRRERIT
jgi:hypothetical protein